MQAWLLPSLSGLSALRLAEVPDPTPQPGQVILSVAYAGLNPADRYLSEGQYPARPAFPHILGRDGLGNIIALGEGVRGHALGDKRLILRTDVGVNTWGTFAEEVAVAAESLVPVPAGWTDQQAAGAPLVYITAYQALTQWGPLPENCVTLITGASGGVGSAAVQLARRRGAHVVALAAADKAATLTELGADRVLGRDADLVAALGADSVDVVIDVVGGPQFPALLAVLKSRGRYAVSGAIAGPIVTLDLRTLYLKDLALLGGTIQDSEVFGNLVSYIERGEIRPLVAATYPLAEIAAAQEAFLAKRHVGKIVLVP